ncbi:hypothetical protein [Hoyosella subflava]|uniref:hypothetical protein n=1 Tax=Hoyosella subflava TaxID=639313 RepID=UPI0011D24BF8|nr:hypothetical protein [Hoyosella subflava]
MAPHRGVRPGRRASYVVADLLPGPADTTTFAADESISPRDGDDGVPALFDNGCLAPRVGAGHGRGLRGFPPSGDARRWRGRCA